MAKPKKIKPQEIRRNIDKNTILRQVADMLNQEMPEKKIIRLCMDKFNIVRTTARIYVNEAKKLKEPDEPDKPDKSDIPKIKTAVERLKDYTGNKRKTDRVVTDRRYTIMQIADMVARQVSDDKLEDFCVNGLKVSLQTARIYIREAKKIVVDLGEDDIRSQLGQIRMKLNLLFDECFLDRNYTMCLKIIDKQAALAGLSTEQGSSENILNMLDKFNKIEGGNGKSLKEGEISITEIMRDPSKRGLLMRQVRTRGQKEGPKKLPPGNIIEGEFEDTGEGDGKETQPE